MKRFLRTAAGKTISFVICIASVLIFAAGLIGIIGFLTDGLRVYTHTEQEFVDEVLADSKLRLYGYQILRNEIAKNKDVELFFDYDYRITDKTGFVMGQTEFFGESKSDECTLKYAVRRERDGRITDCYYQYEGITAQNLGDGTIEYCTVVLKPVEGSLTASELKLMTTALVVMYILRYGIYAIALGALLLAIFSFVALMSTSGHRPDTDEIIPGPLYKVPFDIMLAACVFFEILLFVAADEAPGMLEIICGIGVIIIGINILLGLCMSAAVRIKQNTLFKNTLIWFICKCIYKVLCVLWKGIKAIGQFFATVAVKMPFIWKSAVVALAISFVELFLIMVADGDQEATVILWMFEKIILIPAVLYIALILRRLQASGRALAGGNLSFHTDTKGMFGDFKRYGEDLNCIAQGMTVAVDERLRSERMKTELITNVSHDIKTPLTSIINYATLLSNEAGDNPRAAEYSEVLVRQSEKLKRLLEDLVEASKAASGNLEVELAPCDAATFVTQAGGEYEEKLRNSDLTLVTRQPEKELRIMADGRRMWRVFENLMNNICKYAQPGTRVYLTLEAQNGNAVFCFKNTSKEALDMSADELTERFTRGDSSRNTEGNGLGLSIAKNLTELQKGSMQVVIDGDLFKVTLSFPIL